MNLQQLIYRVGELPALSQKLQSDIKDFINFAQTTICETRNWSFMHDRRLVTMPANATSVAMPAGFKGLSSERSPVSYNQPTSGFPIPVDVVSREKVESMGYGWRGWYTLVPNGYLPVGAVFFEQNGETWTLNVPTYFTNMSAIGYNVSGYFFPDDLELGTDSNGLTINGYLGEALVNLAKAMLFEADEDRDPSGKKAARCRALYTDTIIKASSADARTHLVGRVLHM